MTASGAMAVKARAMFGKRLKENDYNRLLQAKSIEELTHDLKQETYFRNTLEGVNEKAIHRGQLEALLRLDIFARLKKLLRYGGEGDTQFVYAAVMDTEILLILMCIRAFTQDDEQIKSDMITRMPASIEHYMSFPVQKLADVHDFDDLLAVLHGTKYEPVIRKYMNRDFARLDYIGLEHTLHETYYDTLLDLIHAYAHGKAADEMKTITLTRAELDNISVIYRIKKYFPESKDDISSLLTPRYALFTKREINTMIEEDDADTIIEKLKKKYHRYIGDVKFTDIEHFTETIRFRLNYHFIEYNEEPSLVLLAYLLLSEMEISNVINIIEAVRYHISPERIRKILIY